MVRITEAVHLYTDKTRKGNKSKYSKMGFLRNSKIVFTVFSFFLVLTLAAAISFMPKKYQAEKSYAALQEEVVQRGRPAQPWEVVSVDPYTEIQLKDEEKINLPRTADAVDTWTVPATYSLRSKAEKSPVKDQGGCGSCSLFAVTAMLETNEAIYCNRPGYILAPQELVSCMPSGDCSSGWSPTGALKYIQTYGQVRESCFPYKASKISCSNKCSEGPASKISSYGSWSIWDPVALTTKTEKDFVEWFYNRGSAVNLGYKVAAGVWHEVELIGYVYQPTTGNVLYEIKNSWGTGWGTGGYGFIDLSWPGDFYGADYAIPNCNYTPPFTITPQTPTPTPYSTCNATCVSAAVSGTCQNTTGYCVTNPTLNNPTVTFKLTQSGCPSGVKVDTSTNIFSNGYTPGNTWLSAALFSNLETQKTWNFGNSSTSYWGFNANQNLYWRILDRGTGNVVNICSSFSVPAKGSSVTPTPTIRPTATATPYVYPTATPTIKPTATATPYVYPTPTSTPPPVGCNASCVSASVSGTCQNTSGFCVTNATYGGSPKVTFRLNQSNCTSGVKVDTSTNQFSGTTIPSNTWLDAALFASYETQKDWYFGNSSTWYWGFYPNQNLYWRIVDRASGRVLGICPPYLVPPKGVTVTPTPTPYTNPTPAPTPVNQTGNLTGRVFKLTVYLIKRGIPNVKVQARNTSTGVVTTRYTDSGGYYTMNSLPVGLYDITSFAGDVSSSYYNWTKYNNTISVNSTNTINFKY